MYPRAKFVSEFGFQSFPSLQSLRPFALNSDLGPFTELSQSRWGPTGWDGEQQGGLGTDIQQGKTGGSCHDKHSCIKTCSC